MREVVMWQSIVGKDFIETFTKIATGEYWASVKDLPIKTVYDRFADLEVEKYREKRKEMRQHGWRAAFLRRDKSLNFGLTLRQGEDPREISFISLSDHISRRQADALQRYADEWDDERDIIDQVTRSMGRKTYAVRHDTEFVKEETP